MRELWNRIDAHRFSYKTKIYVFLLVNCIIYGLLGFLSFLIIRYLAFDSLTGALCFIGYPLVCVGYFGGIIFLLRQ